VLVFDAADVEVPDAPTALEENGLSVALYRHGGMGYAITSDLAQSDMMRLVSSSF
jgi:anti-sigma factor RsiW